MIRRPCMTMTLAMPISYDNRAPESSPKNFLFALAFRGGGGGKLYAVLEGLAGANSFRCPPATGGHLSSYVLGKDYQQ